MLHKIVIFGNSGSGKSTLARRIAQHFILAHLDLDDIAWKAANPPVRNSMEESKAAIDAFLNTHDQWIIEGCYGSLISHAVLHASEIYFLNIGIEACIQNCKARDWEPHKYETKEAQDKNLQMLTDWVRNYETRNDEFSLKQHQKIFEQFKGKKQELKSNKEAFNLPDATMY